MSMDVAYAASPDKTARVSARVAVARTAQASYLSQAPYHPDRAYPEYRFGPAGLSRDPNPAYQGVREALRLYGWDEDRFGTRDWNPLGNIVRPGDRVVIKPNFVLHYNRAGHGLEPMVTHPSVLRAIADYVFLALKGEGSLVIADAPQFDCDFQALSEWAQLEAVRDFYRRSGLELEVVDMRKLRVRPGAQGLILSADRVDQEGDPLGYVKVDLGRNSELDGLPHVERLYGSDYDRSPTIRHHWGHRHEYLIGRTILSADVIINAPKMKVHKKVGVTLNIKNLVGINGDKNYLPHYRVGAPREGGDAYPDTMDARCQRVAAVRAWLTDRLLARYSRFGDFLFVSISRSYRALRDLFGLRWQAPVDAGNWHGNDTCWRMAIDLNTILFFADAEGRLQGVPQRRFFSVVDGIIGGELGGPLEPAPVRSGVIAVGEDPWAVDVAVTRLMGFDWRKIPQLAAFRRSGQGGATAGDLLPAPADDLQIVSNDAEIESMMGHTHPIHCPFRPHPGWAGHIELENRQVSGAIPSPIPFGTRT